MKRKESEEVFMYEMIEGRLKGEEERKDGAVESIK